MKSKRNGLKKKKKNIQSQSECNFFLKYFLRKKKRMSDITNFSKIEFWRGKIQVGGGGIQVGGGGNPGCPPLYETLTIDQ